MEQAHSERRGTVLVLASLFANGYLVLFMADAVLSIFDAVAGFTGTGAGFAELVSELLLLATLAMLFVVIFIPHLPKLVFVPLILFVFWAAFGAPPFDLTVPSTVVAVSALEGALVGAVLLINKMRTGAWLMRAQLLPHKTHLVLRAVASFVVLGLMLPTLAFGLMLVAFGSMIEKQTGGYLQFTSSGIQVRETVLQRENKTVRLVGMIHVGEASFYDKLYGSFAPTSLVLAEGVTDREGKLAGGFSYKGLAAVLGLNVQPQLGAPAGRSDEAASSTTVKRLPPPDAQSHEPISIPATATRPRVIYADADVSDFAPITVKFLGKVGELYSSHSFGELLDRLNAIGEQFTEKDLQDVFDDILGKRNSRVLAEFDQRVGEYDTIIIPWGAQHMPGLEAALIQRGFKIQSQQMLDVARYQTVVDRLWQVLQNAQSKTSFWYRQKKWIG